MYISSDTRPGQASFPAAGVPGPFAGLSDDIQMIQKELERGMNDPNQLTNIVFFSRHKDRDGRKLDPKESGYQKLRREWLDIRDKLVIPTLKSWSSKPAPTQSSSCPGGTLQLEYEGSPEKNRCIQLTDKELDTNYVDWNIIDSTATVDSDAGKILRWEVHYKDGRSKLFDPDTVPIIAPSRPTQVRVSLIDHYLMKKDGFIYPIDFRGNIRYDWVQTPILIEMRHALDVKVKALKKLRLLIWLTGIFAGAVANNAKGISSIQSISGRPINPTNLQILEQLTK